MFHILQSSSRLVCVDFQWSVRVIRLDLGGHQISLGPQFFFRILRSHKLHFLDGKLGIFRGYSKMPHSPYYISKIGEHMNLYPLSQCSHLSSTNLTHAGTELKGTQTGLPQTETHNVCLHGSCVYSEQGRVTIAQSWKTWRKTLSYEQERWQPVSYFIFKDNYVQLTLSKGFCIAVILL